MPKVIPFKCRKLQIAGFTLAIFCLLATPSAHALSLLSFQACRTQRSDSRQVEAVKEGSVRTYANYYNAVKRVSEKCTIAIVDVRMACVDEISQKRWGQLNHRMVDLSESQAIAIARGLCEGKMQEAYDKLGIYQIQLNQELAYYKDTSGCTGELDQKTSLAYEEMQKQKKGLASAIACGR